jgi:hypothetical protein
MAGERQGLDGEHQGLQTKDQRMHQPESIEGVETNAPNGAGLACHDGVMVARIAFAIQLLPGVTPSSPPVYSGSRKTSNVRGRANG